MDYAVRCMEDNRGKLDLNVINQLLIYADDVAILGDSEEVQHRIHIILLNSTEDIGLEGNIDKTKSTLKVEKR